jgi:uncharacterized protein
MFATLLSDPLLLTTLLGAVVGLVLALTGAGGGIIAVPLLVFGLNLPMQQASPIGLLAVGLAASLGAWLGLRRGILRYRAASLIGGFGIALAPAGVWLAQHLPNQPLMFAFALVLLWTAWQMLRRTLHQADAAERAAWQHPCVLDPEVGKLAWTRPCARALAGTGMLSGLLSGLLGVGGGFVIVPALTRYTNLPAESILATSLGVIALVALGGVSAAAVSGSIAWAIALPFSAGAATGLVAGRLIGSRLEGKRLQQGFALLCLIVAGLLAARAAGLAL